MVASFSVFFIIASILTFCLKTHNSMRVTVLRNVTLDVDDAADPSPAANESSSGGATAWRMEEQRKETHAAFFYIECVCNAWFTFEVIIRFVVAHNKAAFVRKPVWFISVFSFFSLFPSFDIFPSINTRSISWASTLARSHFAKYRLVWQQTWGEAVGFVPACLTQQEAQLPQRNSASAAHVY